MVSRLVYPKTRPLGSLLTKSLEVVATFGGKLPHTFPAQYLELPLSVSGENFQQNNGLNRWMNKVDDNVQPFRHNSLYSIMHFVVKRPNKYRERS